MTARVDEIDFEFIESAPQALEPAKLYISTKYRAIVHLCLCGCGEKVVLNLNPRAWSFTFDGRSISVHDSVGNVGLPCRSHYLIRNSHVRWLPPLRLDPTLALAHREPKDRPPAERARNWLPRWFKARH